MKKQNEFRPIKTIIIEIDFVDTINSVIHITDMQVKIKICGITKFEDARAALNMGTDALGFVFDENNPRYIVPKMARRIIDKLPPFITKVGVFRDASLKTIIKSVQTAGVDTIQFNGNESPETVAQISMPVIKAFAIGQDFDLAILEAYTTSAFILDTWNKTSQSFSWDIAKRIVRKKQNVILSGRLGITNIREALDEVAPYGVDICESVEVMPGVKNPQKMGAVIKIIKEWK